MRNDALLTDVGPGGRNRANVKLATLVILIVIVCPTSLLADNWPIPVERERIGHVPLAGYEARPYDGSARIYVPPPPGPAEQDYNIEYRHPGPYVPNQAPTLPEPMTTGRQGREGGLGIGLCYTGPLVKYFVTDNFAVELRDYINDDAYVIAPRLVGLFDIPKSEFYEFCYYGMEAGRVNFRGRVSRGGGTTAGCFVGIEKEIFTNVMLNVDAGPYWISIKDNQTGIRETGVDFVINSSICWMLR